MQYLEYKRIINNFQKTEKKKRFPLKPQVPLPIIRSSGTPISEKPALADVRIRGDRNRIRDGGEFRSPAGGFGGKEDATGRFMTAGIQEPAGAKDRPDPRRQGSETDRRRQGCRQFRE
jgi:hypothetical protein